MLKRVNLNWLFLIAGLAWLIDLFLPHPENVYRCDPGSAILVSLAVSAIATGASAGLQYALTPKPKKPDPIDRGKLDDVRISIPAYGAQIIKAWGTARAAPTWFWHTPAIDVPITTPGQQGGKGGGGTPPTPDVTEHRYFKNMAGVFHDGQIQYVRRIWFDNELVMNNDGPTLLTTGTSSTRYEAEYGVLAGGASVTTQAECSEGRKVTGLGSGGDVTIHCDVATTATYEVAVGYTSTVQRTFKISVNGGALTDLVCAASGGAGLVAVETTSLALTSGANTIKFENAGAAAPDLDYVAIAPTLAFDDGVDRRSFTGIQTPGRIAPTDPDTSWPINDEPPVFTEPTGGLAGNNQQTATLAKWGSPQIRIYLGSETQEPDSLIESIKGVGNTSAYRGMAYIVIEGLMLQNGRIPNVTIEFVEGTRACSEILNSLSEMVGLTPASDLDTTALNGLILGDASGFNPGSYSAINWTGIVNATQTGGGAITKTSGANNTYNAYAVQGTTVSAGTDAAIRFTAGTGVYLIGFSTTATPGSVLPNPYNQIPFAILINTLGNPSHTAKNAFQMSLGGSDGTTDMGVWAPGDQFQIEIRNGRFMAYQNGLLLSGFTPPPATFPLYPIWVGYATGGGPSAASYATGTNIGSEPIVVNAGALILDSQREASELVEELMTRFQFILPEVDSKIKAVLLSASSDLTLTEAECQAYRGDGLPPKIQISRKNPLTFPKKTIINYSDPQLDYHANAQVETRLYGPQKGTLNVNLAMVETGANMKRLAAVLSSRAEVEGQTYKFSVGPKYKRIHQGTVLTITEGSSTHQVRVTNFRPDLPAGLGEVEAVRQSSVFNPTVATPTIGTEEPVVPIPGNTIGVMIDGPLLRAGDAGDGSQPVTYVAMCGRGSGNWPAGLLHKEFPFNSGNYVLELVALTPSGIGVGSGAESTINPLTAAGKPGSSGSVDGCIDRSGEGTWAGARDAATGSGVDPGGTGLLYAEASLDAGTYSVIRSLLHFNTSSIPDDAIILSASLTLKCNAKSADQSDTVVVVASNIVSDTDYAVADFDLFGSTRLSEEVPISGFSGSTAKVITLNAAGIAAISKTGTTKLGLRTGKDIDNIAPTARRFVNFLSADTAGTSDDPKLTITYVVPGLISVTDATLWDRTSSLTINFLSNTSLESVTEQQLLNDPELNLLAVVNPSTGETEMIQFATAVAGTAAAPYITKYTVSIFLRGRAATDANVSNHSAQDDVVVIDSSVQPHRLPVTDIGRTLKLKFLTSGQQLDFVPVTEQIFRGNSLKPLAPANLKGSRNAAGDLFITWVRRDRTFLPLRDLAGTPLSEESEVYIIEIYSGATLKRTVRTTHIHIARTAVWAKFFDPLSEVTINADQSLTAASPSLKPVVVSSDHFSGNFLVEFTRVSDAPPKHLGVMPAANNDPEDGLAPTGFPYYLVTSGTFYPMGNTSYGASSSNGDRFTIKREGNVVRFYKNPHLSATPVPLYETSFTSEERLKLFAKFTTGAQGLAPTSITTLRGYNYTANQQVDDFGSTQSSIAVKVYQESAIVGKGYPAEATL